MNDHQRIINFLKEIEKIWAKHPELRFGQFIENLAHHKDTYYIEDNELLQSLKECYAKKEKKKKDLPD